MSRPEPRRTAVVTGAAGGIGQAIAEQLIAQGYFVHGVDQHPPRAALDESRYLHHALNVTDFTRLAQLCAEAPISPAGNVLVNCAGLREICPIGELSLALWEEIFAVNVTATFVAAKAFCEALAEHGRPGAVINIASVSGLLGEPRRTAYVTSKHAVLGLTKQLAIEFGKAGIRVNAVAPGVIRTPLTEAYFHDEQQVEKIKAGQFLDHCGVPADVAAAVLFLASEQARFMTGSTLVIDGGWTAGKNL